MTAAERHGAAATSTQQLLDVSVAYARASTLDEVARVLFTLGLAPLEVANVAFAVPSEGRRSRLLGLTRSGAGVEIIWRTTPLPVPAFLLEALASGTPASATGQEEICRRWPAAADGVRAAGVRSLVALPVDTAGRRQAALLVTFDEERVLDPAEEIYLRGLLALTGQALERVRIVADRKRSEARQLLVQGAVSALAGARSVEDVLDVIADQMFPAYGADGMMLSLVRGERVVLARSRGYRQALMDALDDLRFDEDTPLADSARRQRTLLFSSQADYLTEFPHLERIVTLSEKRAWAFVPLVASGRPLGTWLLSWAAEREFADAEQAELITLAGLCSQALERARLFDDEHAIATALQQALLPQELPSVPAVATAARYLPGGPAQQVGGDFYDVVTLDANSLVVAVGDVAGHDIRAAGVMGGVRHAIRAYTVEGHGPTGVLERAHRLLHGEGELFTTCCYLRLDLSSGAATLVSAGHPTPVLLRDGQPPRQLDAPVGPPLGVAADAPVEETTVVLAPGDTLLLFTDGLVERPHRPLSEGLTNLLRVCARHTGDDLDTLLDDLLHDLGERTARDDDIALLALRFTPVAGAHEPDRVTRRLDDTARSPALARRFASDVLASWGLDELADAALLVVSEAVTNAVAHTVGDTEIALVREASSVRIEVSDSSDRTPTLRGADHAADDTAESGRGLFIVDAVAQSWGVEPHTNGKTLWVRLALDA